MPLCTLTSALVVFLCGGSTTTLTIFEYALWSSLQLLTARTR